VRSCRFPVIGLAARYHGVLVFEGDKSDKIHRFQRTCLPASVPL